MNNDERDQLLVRVDERVQAISTRMGDWIDKHEDQHKEERARNSKWILALFSLVAGTLAKMFFWK